MDSEVQETADISGTQGCRRHHHDRRDCSDPGSLYPRRAPMEGCGLLAAVPGSNRIDRCFTTRNAASSARRYLVDPRIRSVRISRQSREGREIVGGFHSHTHTDAYPSPTDVAAARDPSWHYVIVSLRCEVPSMRSFAISGGIVTEASTCSGVRHTAVAPPAGSGVDSSEIARRAGHGRSPSRTAATASSFLR